MNSFSLAFRQLARRPLQTFINALVMGLGVGMVVLLMLGQEQLRERMSQDANAIDLVVGPAGSPMQLILSTVFHIDVPIGNIPWAARDIIHEERAVKRTIPLAVGDNYQGYRIVGTEAAYADIYDGQLRSGEFWTGDMQAVVGAEAARQTGLTVGAEFEGMHGLGQGGPVHGDHPYEVVGVLGYTGSILDRLILTSVESVWKVHDGHDHSDDHSHDLGHNHGNDGDHHHEHHHDHAEQGGELTAILVQYASPMAATRLPTLIDRDTPWQAARPAHESARLFSMLGPAVDGLRWIAILLVSASLLGVFALLYQSLSERRYDLAVMRAMGGGPGLIFRLTLLEGIFMVLTGLVMGLLLGHGATELLGQLSNEGRAMMLSGWHWAKGQSWLIAGILLAGLVVALLPACLAARVNVAKTLRRGY